MKKLLTTIAACAFAFGAFADDETLPTGTSFENDAGVTAITGLEDADYWSTATGGALDASYGVAVTNYLANELYSGLDGRPEIAPALAADDELYLAINTPFTNGVTRSAWTNDAPAIGEGIYFDSLVKLTATDDEKPATDDDPNIKLKIWARETDGATNLFVSAGYYDAENNKTEKDYNCGPIDDIDQWQRITIKAINVAKTGTPRIGFVVYRNGSALWIRGTSEERSIGSGMASCWFAKENLNTAGKYYFNDNSLFPSLDQTSAAAGKVASVTFAGKGAVDDVTFTRTAPEFAELGNTFMLSYDENVLGFTYQLDTDTPVLVTNDTGVAGSEPIPFMNSADHTVTIANVTYAEGFKAGTWTAAEGAELSGSTFTLTSGATAPEGAIVSMSAAEYVFINETAYPDLATAFPYLSTLPAGDYTLSLASDATAAALRLDGEAGFITWAKGVSITIDLNGKTITGDGNNDYSAIIVSGAESLTITDTSLAQTGCISAPENVKAVKAFGALTIQAGTFDGQVDISEDSETVSVYGGQFSYADNTVADAFALAGNLASGRVVNKDVDVDPQYWIVTEQVMYTVTFAAPHATSIPEPSLVADGATVADPGAPKMEEGYNFTEWTLGGVAYNFATPVTSNFTLTATYSLETWNITYYDEEENVFTNDTYNIENRTSKELNDGYVEGYTFNGWTDEYGAPVVLATSTGDLELYGTWTKLPENYDLTVPSVANTTLAIYTNSVAEAAYTAAGTYSLVENTTVAVTYTADENYTIGGEASWTTNVTMTADFELLAADIPAVESSGGTHTDAEVAEEIEEAKAGEPVDVTGKTVTIDNVNHTVTIGETVAELEPYYVATQEGNTLTVSLTTNEELNGTKIEADALTDTPALAFDDDGHIVIGLPNAKAKLYYAVDYCDTPSFTGTVTTVPVTVTDGTVLAPLSGEGGRFYRMRVSDKPILVEP